MPRAFTKLYLADMGGKLAAPRSSVAGGMPERRHCNTGHQAATNWFVLSEVLRRPGVSLYDGSLSQWAQDESRPVETGAGPVPSR
jgi:hypothetical protein